MGKDFVLYEGASVTSLIKPNGARFVRLKLFIKDSPDSESQAMKEVVIPSPLVEELCLRLLQGAGRIPNDSENLAGPVQ